jgi:hypothetical protein
MLSPPDPQNIIAGLGKNIIRCFLVRGGDVKKRKRELLESCADTRTICTTSSIVNIGQNIGHTEAGFLFFHTGGTQPEMVGIRAPNYCTYLRALIVPKYLALL